MLRCVYSLCMPYNSTLAVSAMCTLARGVCVWLCVPLHFLIHIRNCEANTVISAKMLFDYFVRFACKQTRFARSMHFTFFCYPFQIAFSNWFSVRESATYKRNSLLANNEMHELLCLAIYLLQIPIRDLF